MPFVRIWIHLIFATKRRAKIITPELRIKLNQHIKENSIEKKIYIDTLNCYKDHMHIFLSLGSTQTISNIAQLIKGESSNWVNKEMLLECIFEWQDDYIALSVSESMADIVRQYIRNQEEHHRKKDSKMRAKIYLKNSKKRKDSP